MIAKRALLISSPYGGLKGPPNDVETIAGALRSKAFEDIAICAGDEATRDGILSAWRRFIDSLSGTDAAVIYYSGHGGLVEQRNTSGQARSGPRQFLVPVDYGDTTDDDFRGILDVELSHLLQATTDVTDNVTFILDCCHSGSMARDPGFGKDAVQRSLDEVQYHSLIKHQDLLRQNGHLPGLADPQGNRKAVRIVASTADERAWESRDGTAWTGAMTRALAKVLEESTGQDIPWRTTMVRVRDLVRLQFSSQHPHVEGPYSRLPFSLRMLEDNAALPVSQNGRSVFIMAGKLRGVYEDNVYSILPYGSAIFDSKLEIAKATVRKVVGFKAKVILDPVVDLPPEGAVAFLLRTALPKWPVALAADLPPEVCQELRACIAQSQFIELPEDPDSAASVSDPLIQFGFHDQDVVLYTRGGVEVSSGSVPTNVGQRMEDPFGIMGDPFEGMIQDAERIARAQHLLSLKALDGDGFSMAQTLGMEVAVVDDGEKTREVQTRGLGVIYPGDNICITLGNKGKTGFYVHLVNVDASGSIQLVTNNPFGVYIGPESEFVIGTDEFGDLCGVSVSWPEQIPKVQPVVDQLVAIQTNEPVDLSYLDDSLGRGAEATSPGQILEQLGEWAGGRTSRTVSKQAGSSSVQCQFTVEKFTLGLQPPVLGRDLPTPEDVLATPQDRVRIRHFHPFHTGYGLLS